MLTIRLSRFGKKKHPVFRIIVSEKAKDTVGDYLELLGTYDPHTNKVELKKERIQHWISKGASTSGVVHNLLIDQKLITGEKIKVANIRKKEEAPKSAEPAPAPKAVEPKTEAVPVPVPETPQPKAETGEAKPAA
ncbi:MAG: 30S ribosomal protein S16 [Patescibacteria group bacterium]|jgi:small subunit ribosomal protein S16